MTQTRERAESWPDPEDRWRGRHGVREPLALVHEAAATQVAPHPERARIHVLQADARRQLESVLKERGQRNDGIPIDVGSKRSRENTGLLARGVGARIDDFLF